MKDNRIRIFTGHFGSGKTEVSINFALNLAGKGMKTSIVDLDIVNPYFSVREVRKTLEDSSIKVIAPTIDITTAELSTVPPEVISVFDTRSYNVIMDVGGDGAGAIALGQYNRFFLKEDYDMYFVINTNRPSTRTVEGICEYVRDIERASRLKVSCFINNTNLSYETDADDILNGQKIIEEASKVTGIPLRYTSIRNDLYDRLPEGISGEILKLKIFMKPEWLE
jgi:tRNA uridine 5-carbamoylmethylation protein Kti12